MARLLKRNTPEKRQSGQLLGFCQLPAPAETANRMSIGEIIVMITTWKKNEFQGHSFEGLIMLKTMAAAVKQVQAQDRDDGYQVMIISCEQNFESDDFQSLLANFVQAEGW